MVVVQRLAECGHFGDVASKPSAELTQQRNVPGCVPAGNGFDPQLDTLPVKPLTLGEQVLSLERLGNPLLAPSVRAGAG